MKRSSENRLALLAAVVFASGCALSQGPPIDPAAKQAVAGRLVGPGPVLTGKFGGPIFGWAIDENGTDGVLTEVTSISDPYTSAIETFDQTKAQVEKIVRKEKSGPEGDRELVVDAIQANEAQPSKRAFRSDNSCDERLVAQSVLERHDQ